MTSNVFRRVLASGAALICALPLLATEVYVNALTGSDTEHGGTSPSDAYQSLTKAMDGRGPGDVVHAAAGTARLDVVYGDGTCRGGALDSRLRLSEYLGIPDGLYDDH